MTAPLPRFYRTLLQLLCRLRRRLRRPGILELGLRQSTLCHQPGLIGGGSTGADRLQRSAARTYNGINTALIAPVLMTRLFGYPQGYEKDGVVSSSSFITNADIPVPTLFAGYAADDASIPYWISVNDAVPYPVNRVYSVRTSILMHGRRFTPIRTRKTGIPARLTAFPGFRCRKTAA